MFFVYFLLKGLVYVIILLYILGIGFKCKLLGVFDNIYNFLIRKLLEGIKRLNYLKDCRFFIIKYIFEKFVKIIFLVCLLNFEVIFFLMVFLVVYYVFLRVGEFILSLN